MTDILKVVGRIAAARVEQHILAARMRCAEFRHVIDAIADDNPHGVACAVCCHLGPRDFSLVACRHLAWREEKMACDQSRKNQDKII